MQVTILSLRKIEYQGQAVSLNVKTTSGEITVLNHHLPLVTTLESGRIILTDNDGQKITFPVNGGFLEVAEGNKLTAFIS